MGVAVDQLCRACPVGLDRRDRQGPALETGIIGQQVCHIHHQCFTELHRAGDLIARIRGKIALVIGGGDQEIVEFRGEEVAALGICLLDPSRDTDCQAHVDEDIGLEVGEDRVGALAVFRRTSGKETALPRTDDRLGQVVIAEGGQVHHGRLSGDRAVVGDVLPDRLHRQRFAIDHHPHDEVFVDIIGHAGRVVFLKEHLLVIQLNIDTHDFLARIIDGEAEGGEVELGSGAEINALGLARLVIQARPDIGDLGLQQNALGAIIEVHAGLEGVGHIIRCAFGRAIAHSVKLDLQAPGNAAIQHAA